MTPTTVRAPARGIPPLADLYVPVTPRGPSVVLVHGGGFVIGSRRMTSMRYLAAGLCAEGIAVCAIDYRLWLRGGWLAEATDDVCDAFAFWSAHGTRLGLDARAISLVGLSAGGTLAMLAAARAPSVHRLACCFGLYEIPRVLRPRTPLPHPAVPTLLLHGSADRLVPVAQARRLAAHREALGLPTRLVVYPDARHGFLRGPSAVAEAGLRAIVDHVAERTGAHA